MSSEILVFTNEIGETLQIERNSAIPLELKLNVSPYGKEWKNIGDILYNFGCNQNIDLCYLISNECFDFLTRNNNNKQ